MKLPQFTITNALASMTVAEAQALTNDARACADRGEPPKMFVVPLGDDFRTRVQAGMRHIVWMDAYDNRVRIKRAAEQGGTRRPMHTK